jgi:GT2 family glycosyltransferase
MRSVCDGAQDWDFVLRVSEIIPATKIRHLPFILYHWRVHTTSTSIEAGVKPYISAAQIRAVSDHLTRTGNGKACVEQLPAVHALRVRYPLPSPPPLISLIIPTKDQVDLLRECVEGLLHRTNYSNIEILIVDNGSTDTQTLSWLRSIPAADPRVSVLRDERPFNYSRLNNWAARQARGTILGFINNDIQIIHPEWLDEMVSHVIRANIAAVGARLLYPNGTIQHAGVITGIGGVAGHPFKGWNANSMGYFYRARLPQDLSAVTAACMLVRKDVFDHIGGFDEEKLSIAFNDVDLCLKIRATGYRVVYTPYAELLHHESASRGYENNPEKQRRFEQEVETMKERWGSLLADDPFYNPNLSLETENFDLCAQGPPRIAGDEGCSPRSQGSSRPLA